ncbi:hypothetical protein Cgig2_028785 [Carnegiea gigantea]|uniref:Uncharacterized protein n=1 Tax=Carnegiea gigantea TaxID=171969 RepID=A0A9Q1JN12_9CARY|nr:hypothetical protein Cgig2_028785 [Carnegiea gigantea]
MTECRLVPLLYGSSADEPVAPPNMSFATIPDPFPPKKRARSQHQGVKKIVITKMFQPVETIPELEEHAISALKPKLPVPICTVGPCIPLSSLDNTNDQPSYMAWLDSQPQKSVLYVSLGTVMPVSSHEVNELAAGLCDSGVPFLWVSREETAKLDGGPGDKGMVIPWCDQMRVLAHGSKANSKLIVEDWGVGWRGKSNNGVQNSLINRETVAGVVKRFMDLESGERQDLERKCKEAPETARTAIVRGGSAEASLDEFLTCVLIKDIGPLD